MKITENVNGDVLEIALEGRLDTATAPQLDEVINTCKEDYKVMVFDFENLEYISSAGLRVLLSANKMNNLSGKGPIIVKNANEIVREVFEVTGFADILTIE